MSVSKKIYPVHFDTHRGMIEIPREEYDRLRNIEREYRELRNKRKYKKEYP